MTRFPLRSLSEANPAKKSATLRKVRRLSDVRWLTRMTAKCLWCHWRNDSFAPIGPWGMNSGYYKNPEATAEACANGWSTQATRSGCDETGFSISLTGQGCQSVAGARISTSFGVESQVIAHARCARPPVIGCRAEYSRREVMTVIAWSRSNHRHDGAGPASWRTGCLTSLVPRLRSGWLDYLPKTAGPTRCRRPNLRSQGSPPYMDREAKRYQAEARTTLDRKSADQQIGLGSNHRRAPVPFRS